MTTEEGEQFAKEHGLVFLETSAKTAHNVEEVRHGMPCLVLTLGVRPAGLAGTRAGGTPSSQGCVACVLAGCMQLLLRSAFA